MVDLYSVASYNVYSVACCGGLVILLCVAQVEADWEVKVKCVCVSCLYAAGSGLRIPAQLQSVTDWLMCRLHRGPYFS